MKPALYIVWGIVSGGLLVHIENYMHNLIVWKRGIYAMAIVYSKLNLQLSCDGMRPYMIIYMSATRWSTILPSIILMDDCYSKNSLTAPMECDST